MSKKKFTAGMESLFKDTPDEFVEVGQDTLSEEENKKKKPKRPMSKKTANASHQARTLPMTSRLS
jgi:hypothetical protein